MSRPPGPKGIQGSLTRYGDAGFSRFLRRAFLASAGLDAEDMGRPVVGIAHTVSDYNPCHRGMAEQVEAVRRGVLQAGGLPLAFPTASLNEIFTSPTTMYLRNLVAMETEELIRAQPMDAVVLLGGCDKTAPAQAMAAISAGVPAVLEVTGPMPAGSWRGQRVGACTDCRRTWAAHRSGEVSEEELDEIAGALCPAGGTCMVMGTASTMACLLETIGLLLPGGATPTSNSGERLRHSVATGRAAVTLARSGGPLPGEIICEDALHNAMVVLSALSGSTNAVIHMAAIARRAGLSFPLAALGEVSAQVPVLADLKPAGSGFMEDLHRAGGLTVLLHALAPWLRMEARDVLGRTLGERIGPVAPPPPWQRTVRSPGEPVAPPGALVHLQGNLAPGGAILKAAAASPHLLRHRGPALVFRDLEDLSRRLDDPDLPVTPEHVLVLGGAGPVGAGMPEAGSFPIPGKLARQGVKDMVRVSDARMSGTAYGTVVLHCSPEAAVGGPMAVVEDGDMVELDVPAGRITLDISEDELARRLRTWRRPPLPERGWARLQAAHVLQAPDGADLDLM